MALVYVHKKKTDETVFYVGIGKCKYRPYSERNRNNHWKNTAKKHGYFVEIIENNIEYSKAQELEIFLIETIGINKLTNITLGGGGSLGVKMSDKTKLKLYESHKGKKLSKESIAKRTKSVLGRKASDETKRKISISATGRKHSKDSLLKMSLAKIGKTGSLCPNSIPVVQLDKNDIFVNRFAGSTEAERITGIRQGNITKVLNNKRPFAGGYKWIFEKDYNELKKVSGQSKK